MKTYITILLLAISTLTYAHDPAEVSWIYVEPGEDINTALSQGNVYLKPGTHYITTTIIGVYGRTITGPDASIRCNIDSLCIKLASKMTLSKFSLIAPHRTYVASNQGIRGTDVDYIAIDNLMIRGIGNFGIQINKGHYVNITNNRIYDFGYAGVQIRGSQFVKVDGNIIVRANGGRPDNGNAYGITFTFWNDGTTGLITRNSSITNNVVSTVPMWDCIDTHGGSGIVIANNNVTNCNRGIDLGMVHNDPAIASSIRSKPVDNISVIGNTVTNGHTNDIRHKYYESHESTNVSIVGNAAEVTEEPN